MRDPLRSAKFFMSETNQARLPASLAEVTFIGRSNVGKSSLICALCDNRSLARVSKTPGRTREINVFETTKGRWLVDLPGYGYSAGPEKEREYWSKMIGHYLTARPTMKMAYVLLDAERGVGPIDFSILQWLAENNVPHKLVGTKTDRVGGSRLKEYRERIARTMNVETADVHWVSAKKDIGVKPLRDEIIQLLGV